jgi:hypothetical protein
MLVQLRATMQDAQFHGYQAARYAYGTILSLLEDGTVTWADSQRMADERHSALIARGTQLREQSTNPQRYSDAPGSNARGGGGKSGQHNVNYPNNPNFAPRVCVFHNQGICAHKGDHHSGGFF